MEPEETQDVQLERANELYWESEESVNRIAEALNVSKGALYGMIQPRAAGIDCPRCDAAMEYPNRTARERGLMCCPGCGLEEDEDVLRDGVAVTGVDGDGAAGVAVSPENGRPAAVWQRLGQLRERDRALVGSLLLGVAAGILIGTLFGRRR